MKLEEIIELNTEAQRSQRFHITIPLCPLCLCVSTMPKISTKRQSIVDVEQQTRLRLTSDSVGFMNSSSSFDTLHVRSLALHPCGSLAQ